MFNVVLNTGCRFSLGLIAWLSWGRLTLLRLLGGRFMVSGHQIIAARELTQLLHLNAYGLSKAYIKPYLSPGSWQRALLCSAPKNITTTLFCHLGDAGSMSSLCRNLSTGWPTGSCMCCHAGFNMLPNRTQLRRAWRLGRVPGPCSIPCSLTPDPLNPNPRGAHALGHLNCNG